ncbi:hypothetical protein FRB91_008352, partial [Serendipita sp. 411]
MNPFLVEDVVLIIFSFAESLAGSEYSWRQELRSYSLVCSRMRALAQWRLFHHISLSRRLSLVSLITETKRSSSLRALLQGTETLTFRFGNQNTPWRFSPTKEHTSDFLCPEGTATAMQNLIKSLPNLRILRLDAQGNLTPRFAYRSLPQLGESLGSHVSSLRITTDGLYLAMPRGQGWSRLKELHMDGPSFMIDLEVESSVFRSTYALVALTVSGMQAFLICHNLWALRSSRDSLTHLTLIFPGWSSNHELPRFPELLPNLQSVTLSTTDCSLNLQRLIKGMKVLRELRLFNLRIEAWHNIQNLPQGLEHLCLDLPSDISRSDIFKIELPSNLKTLDLVVGYPLGGRMKAAISAITHICNGANIRMSSFVGDVPRSCEFPARRIPVQYQRDSPTEYDTKPINGSEVAISLPESKPTGPPDELVILQRQPL